MNIEKDFPKLREMLIRHEGVRFLPYKCTEGFLTIGVGHRLDSMPISERAAMVIFHDDLERIIQEAAIRIPAFRLLDSVRRDIILDMCFQMGVSGVLKFKKMLEALRVQDYEKAAEEMVDSLWFKQTPERAKELIQMMKTGNY